MRESAHYFHDVVSVKIKKIVDEQTGAESLQMIAVDKDGDHAVVNVFFNGEAMIDSSVPAR